MGALVFFRVLIPAIPLVEKEREKKSGFEFVVCCIMTSCKKHTQIRKIEQGMANTTPLAVAWMEQLVRVECGRFGIWKDKTPEGQHF